MEFNILSFINVCQTVIHEYCQTDVKCGEVYYMAKDEYISKWDISGIMGLSGKDSGVIAISLNRATAIRITSILTNTEHTFIDADVSDTVEKIINAIVVNAKKHFDEKRLIKISSPSMVKGIGHSIVWPSGKNKIICVPFQVFTDQEICLSFSANPAA